MRPRPGNALVRSITADPVRPSGLLLLPDTITKLTAQQMELVTMGPPTPLDEPDPREEATQARLQALEPGAWLVLKHRTWIESDTPDHYFIPQAAIVAVIR